MSGSTCQPIVFEAVFREVLSERCRGGMEIIIFVRASTKRSDYSTKRQSLSTKWCRLWENVPYLHTARTQKACNTKLICCQRVVIYFTRLIDWYTASRSKKSKKQFYRDRKSHSQWVVWKRSNSLKWALYLQRFHRTNPLKQSFRLLRFMKRQKQYSL